MFSETACSMNRLGAMTGTLPSASISSSSTAARAAPMVGMGMGEDHSRHRPLAAVLEVKIHRARAPSIEVSVSTTISRRCRPRSASCWAMSSPRNLINAGYHFEQPVVHVQPRLPPQAGVNGGRRLFLGKKAVGLEAPDHPALCVDDPRMFQRAEKAACAACGVVEITRVGKRQRLQRRRRAARSRRLRRPWVFRWCLLRSWCGAPSRDADKLKRTAPSPRLRGEGWGEGLSRRCATR